VTRTAGGTFDEEATVRYRNSFVGRDDVGDSWFDPQALGER
jgi:hypothetical protein